MTYYGRTENEAVALRLALRVEGVPYVFVTESIPGAQSGYTQVVCITRATEGEARLDLDERRETAPTLDVEMLDTDADLFRTLFAAASRPIGWVSTADAQDPTDTVVYVNDTSVFAVDDVIYVADETMIVTAVASIPDTIDVTRGAYGSTAREGMTGETATGDEIFTTPPHWYGRRAYLYGYTPDGSGAFTETLLGVYVVDEAPRHTGGKGWAMRLAGVAQEYFERVVGLGLEAATVTDYGTWSAPDDYEVPVTETLVFQTSATMDSYVLIRDEDGRDQGVAICKLIDVDDVNGTITVARQGSFGTTNLRNLADYTQPAWNIRQIGVIQAPGAASILIALLSTDGQSLSGGNYLPGRPRYSTGANSSRLGWRLGAGFAAGEVDSDSFDAITSIPPMTIVIDGERRVTELLREWCYLTGSAVVTTVDGKLKAVPIGASRATSGRTLGANDVIPEGPIEVIHDEGGIFPIVKLRAGYSPITGEFHDELTLVDVDLAKRYRRTPQTREIEIRSIDVYEPRLSSNVGTGWRHPTRMRAAAITTLMSDVSRANGRGARRFVRLALSHEHMDLRLGDVVTIGTDLPDGYDELPDMRGSTLRGATCRVVARRPRYDQARVDVQLEIMDRLLHVCPAAVIASHVVDSPSPGQTTLTLATTGPEVSGSSPTDDFYVGASLIVVDRSTPANTQDAIIVNAITSGTVMEVDSPAFTIQNGVDYIVLDPEASTDGTTGSGYQLIEFAKLSDAAGVAGANPATDVNPRWR